MFGRRPGRDELLPAPAGTFWQVGRTIMTYPLELRLWPDGCRPDEHGWDYSHRKPSRNFKYGAPHRPLATAPIWNEFKPNLRRASRKALQSYARQQASDAAIAAVAGVH